MSDHLSIVADIGGTNTRVALARGLNVDQTSIQRFRNSEYSGLAEILSTYLAERSDAAPIAACAAIAGPVRDGKGAMTNLDWTIDRDLLRSATGATTTSVINDLQAQGHALQHLDQANCIEIREGAESSTHAARLVIGVGTGFNAAPVYRTDVETLVPPSESGHVDLPTPSEELRAYADFITQRLGFCAVEELLSGRGLADLYEWHSGGTKIAPSEVMERVVKGDTHALASITTFAHGLGVVAGNLALTTLPFGGIYLVGGVARAVTPYLSKHGFEAGFKAKGRFGDFMDQFAVYSVDDDYAALTGMAALLNEIIAGPTAR